MNCNILKSRIKAIIGLNVRASIFKIKDYLNYFLIEDNLFISKDPFVRQADAGKQGSTKVKLSNIKRASV